MTNGVHPFGDSLRLVLVFAYNSILSARSRMVGRLGLFIRFNLRE